MPSDNIYNSIEEYKHIFKYNFYYNPITNSIRPYKSWIPPSHNCYTPEIPNYMICFDFSSFKKKPKKETLEIE